MANLSKNNKERLSMLNGCETVSIDYEGCVYIKGVQIFRDGDVIDTLNTNKKINNLWSEYLVNEGL